MIGNPYLGLAMVTAAGFLWIVRDYCQSKIEFEEKWKAFEQRQGEDKKGLRRVK